MSDMLVVGSKIKAYVKEKGLHSSSDLGEALSKENEALLNKAVARCQANKRSTVRPADL
ncbi:hypothetical protein KKC16_01440 [Patescibacteria group bacterium]|nr:hypothetical protein [Patescibacteria group bacterium]MBU4482098.1 hypothetical protein [Patescibacteria group bacterium]